MAFTGGQALAYSYVDMWRSDEYHQDNAFRRQTKLGKPWLSQGSLPQAVWYRFPTALSVVRFGFRDRREVALVSNNPVSFAFIGAENCSNSVWFRDWTVIQKVGDGEKVF